MQPATPKGWPVSFWGRGDEARLASTEVIRHKGKGRALVWLCTALHKRPSPRKQAFYSSRTLGERLLAP